MTKLEYARCEKLMEEAIRKAEQSKEEFSQFDSCNSFTDKYILLQYAREHLGYAEGINQTLVCIGFKHERMKELGDLL